MESVPQNKNYELQQAYLRQKQAEVSVKLFEAGVTPRILNQFEGSGAKIASDGLNMLDVQCFPVRKKRPTADGDETVIQLCVKQPDRQRENAASYKYIPIGPVDTSGVVINPYDGIEQDDADAINFAAMDIVALRDSGELPDLEWTLQSARNPNTAIQLPK